MMRKSPTIANALVAMTALVLPSLCVLAAEPPAPPPSAPPMMGPPGPKFNWFEHTQRTLSELKVKLNLIPGQMAAWETWSNGVMTDARSQIVRMKDRQEQMANATKFWEEGATPERMQRGIERIRAEIKRMQDHLAQLEAAQARTSAFYGQLDTNQKTIFDLFWRDVHNRMAGPMEGMGGPQ
jgi:hypothetical protein